MTGPSSFSSIRFKVVLVFALALTAMSCVGFLLLRSTRAFSRTAQRAAETQRVLELHESMLRQLMEAENAARGFLLTGDALMLDFFRQAKAGLEQTRELERALADSDAPAAAVPPGFPGSAGQRELLTQIQKKIGRKVQTLQGLMELRGREGPEAAMREFSVMNQEGSMQEIRTMMAGFRSNEERILQGLTSQVHRVERETWRSLWMGSGVTVVMLLIALALILRDVAARRRAEDMLAQERNLLLNLIDAIPDSIYIKDLHGRFLLDNAAHRRFHGAECLAGHSVFDVAPRELAMLYQRDDQWVAQTGKSILSREEPAMAPGGKLVWLSTTKAPFRDVSGEMVGLVCISTDISERKADEEKLRNFAAQLERSNAELSDFASIASHDLQEPLRKIRAFGDRLRLKCADALSEQGLDYLARMESAAGRMQTLIQDLLTLSRVTSRGQPFVPTDLGQVVREALSDLELRIEQTGASIEVGELPTIDADPVQMRQLFQNLVANALKFQKPGEKPEISISARLLPLEEQMATAALAPQFEFWPALEQKGARPNAALCQIVVADNGIGFGSQFSEQIFALFQRLHSRQEYEGTGIGLSVCRKIAHRHGGSIIAKSEEGQGATFIIKLPVNQNTQS